MATNAKKASAKGAGASAAGDAAAKAVAAPVPPARKSGLGLLGRKLGMTRIFSDDGESVPCTVLEVGNNRITQVKTAASDGYDAIQLTHGVRRASRIAKAQAGHFAKAGVEGGSVVREFRVKATELAAEHGEGKGADIRAGVTLPLDLFAVGQKVDVTGTSIGKGFAGAIKRHHFSSNRATHGNSVSTNAPGSIGMRQDPGRVMPGKRMAGHLGDVRRTTHNLVIARIDTQRQLLLVRGAVPGARGASVIVRPAVKP